MVSVTFGHFKPVLLMNQKPNSTSVLNAITLGGNIDSDIVCFVQEVIPQLPPQYSLLDACGGHGRFVAGLEHATVTLIDSSQKAITCVRERMPHVRTVLGDILTHDFEHVQFEVVLLVDALHLFPQKQLLHAFETMRMRILPGGILFMTAPLRILSVESIKEMLLQTGFEDVVVHEAYATDHWVPLTARAKL